MPPKSSSLPYRAVKTASYSRPIITDWIGLREWNRELIVQNYAIDIFKSIAYNIAKSNDKGTYLNGAQDWFRNSLYLLIMFTIILSTAIAFTSPNNEPLFEQQQPVKVVVFTPTPISTSIPTMVATQLLH